jgi:hypothetical protein
MSTFRVKNSSDVIPVETTYVRVISNKIKELPPLPVSLTRLDCFGCTSLRRLPPLSHCVGLKLLYCYDCTSLRELPPLPMSLIQLHCAGCTSLRDLPHLPVGLTELYCFNCTSLRELPPLSHCVGFTRLHCYYCTSLRDLPPLPVSLIELNCSYCVSLRKLPPLPVSLTSLDCDGCTFLLYLPTIPHTCEYYGPSLPTEEVYFEQANVKKKEELRKSEGDVLLINQLGDPAQLIWGYLSFGKTRKSKGKGNSKKKKSSRRKSR